MNHDLTGSTAWATQVSTGDEARARIRQLAAHIDANSTAYCTSSAWLGAAAAHLPGQPVVITVGGDDGEVAGLAALTRRRQRGSWRIELLGGEFNDYGQFYVDSDAAADALAAAIVMWVEREHRFWSLDLAQLADDDVVLAELVSFLSAARVVPGVPIPQIDGIGTEYVVSRNRRRKANNALNRIAADECRGEQLAVRDRPGLDHWLPAVIAARRNRDHACGRRSHLDDPWARAFYQAYVRDLCDDGALTLDLLLVDGEVAGYGMVVAEPGVHRVFDGRVAVGFEHYRGAIVCDLAAVARASADPSVHTFDWLRGRTDGKFGNHEVQRVDLHATSGAMLDRLDRWERAARTGVKAVLPAGVMRRIAER